MVTTPAQVTLQVEGGEMRKISGAIWTEGCRQNLTTRSLQPQDKHRIPVSVLVHVTVGFHHNGRRRLSSRQVGRARHAGRGGEGGALIPPHAKQLGGGTPLLEWCGRGFRVDGLDFIDSIKTLNSSCQGLFCFFVTGSIERWWRLGVSPQVENAGSDARHQLRWQPRSWWQFAPCMAPKALCCLTSARPPPGLCGRPV